ncbi:hypothetical protein A3F06_02245 [candidate division TM6 bacterium RIFCSPHIGHO2_12_FULL_36_22]|nr:MAG: hypothetical protein A3F06_02245 [candidate division TM6 bacterium RIFCSPHIGHO2_12_FULL_36_22]
MIKSIIRISFLVALLFGFSALFAKIETGRSYLSVWPAFQINSPERVSMHHHQMRLYDDQRRHEFDLTVLGGQSTDSKKLAKYFAPFGKTCLRVGELGSDWAKTGKADIIANYFNIFTSAYPIAGQVYQPTINNYTFKSVISFEPEYKYYGLGAHYRYHFSCDPEKGFWFDMAAPLVRVETDMGLTERIITPGGPGGENPQVPVGYVGSMTEAFKQDGWQFGKIDGPRRVLRITDIQLGIGYTYIKEETHYLQSYMGVLIATGNKPNAIYLFEPIAGNGGHNGLIFGMNLGFTLWACPTQSIALNVDTSSSFFLHNYQIRSFDLKNNTWSRYMFVYADKKAELTSNGINTFTRQVKVGHGFVRNLNLAATYTHCNGFQVEGGYQFFAQSAESVHIECNWQTGPAIAALWNDRDDEFITGTGNTTAAGISRNNARINAYEFIGNDKVLDVDGVSYVDGYHPITEGELDLESAVTPGYMTHTFYASIGRYWDHLYNPKFLGAGVSYEFSDENYGLDRWMLWATIGFTF